MKANSLNPVFDRQQLLERCLGEQDFAFELVTMFLDQAPSIMEALAEAICGQEQIKVGRFAHSLKGMAMNIGALSLGGQLRQIEMAGSATLEQLRQVRTVYFETLEAVYRFSQSLAA